MIIDCLADLHGNYPELEGGDLLIVAGDLTAHDDYEEFEYFQRWLNIQDYERKVIVAGNHDKQIERNPNWLKGKRWDYLCDSGTEFEFEKVSNKEWGSREGPLGHVPYEKKKLKIWGSPWVKSFPKMNPKCKAFTLETEEELAEKWELIPEDVDILITHGPPLGINDWNVHGESCGSMSLFMKAASLPNLKLFVFGHIHEAYGILDTKKVWNKIEYKEALPQPMCKSWPIIVNCSHVNERYNPVNSPVRVVL